MTYEEARVVVDKISHPFMLFTLEKVFPYEDLPNDYSRIVTLRISHKCVDAVTLEPIVINRSRKMCLNMSNEESLVEEVWRCVKNAAMHEAGEFFKYEGKLVHDPHDRAAL